MTGPSIDPKSLKGVVLDDTDGERKGPWAEASAADGRHLGSGFLQDNNTNKGEVSIVYTPEILEGGDYKIILISPPHIILAVNLETAFIFNTPEKVAAYPALK